MQCESWEDLQDNDISLPDKIMQGLANVQHGLSQEAVTFLCSYNNVRRDGNYSAHVASQGEIKEAIETKPVSSQERRYLEQLYEFVFSVPVIRLDLSS